MAASKRSNPTTQMQRRIVLNQGEVNPQGNDGSTDKGIQPLMVKQNKKNTISQKVSNPSVGAARGQADVVTPGKQKR
jgi:hypothetical protein